jgi:hypothetical protein
MPHGTRLDFKLTHYRFFIAHTNVLFCCIERAAEFALQARTTSAQCRAREIRLSADQQLYPGDRPPRFSLAGEPSVGREIADNGPPPVSWN